jgi:magnesium transporter
MLRELIIGFSAGRAILGTLGGVGAAIISQSADIGLVVGLSLFVASTVASVLASLLPITFKGSSQ